MMSGATRRFCLLVSASYGMVAGVTVVGVCAVIGVSAWRGQASNVAFATALTVGGLAGVAACAGCWLAAASLFRHSGMGRVRRALSTLGLSLLLWFCLPWVALGCLSAAVALARVFVDVHVGPVL